MRTIWIIREEDGGQILTAYADEQAARIEAADINRKEIETHDEGERDFVEIISCELRA